MELHKKYKNIVHYDEKVDFETLRRVSSYSMCYFPAEIYMRAGNTIFCKHLRYCERKKNVKYTGVMIRVWRYNTTHLRLRAREYAIVLYSAMLVFFNAFAVNAVPR